MGIVENIKKKKAIKEIQPKLDEMTANWNDLINKFNTGLESSNALELYEKDSYSYWENILSETDGQTFRVGAYKSTRYADNSPTSYEFIFLTTNSNGQLDTNYYTLTANGNFTSEKGLASFNIGYLASAKGLIIPCNATINMNSGDLSNIFKAHINPVVTPLANIATPEECQPNMNDITRVIGEFCRINNIVITKQEGLSDFMPGID